MFPLFSFSAPPPPFFFFQVQRDILAPLSQSVRHTVRSEQSTMANMTVLLLKQVIDNVVELLIEGCANDDEVDEDGGYACLL